MAGLLGSGLLGSGLLVSCGYYVCFLDVWMYGNCDYQSCACRRGQSDAYAMIPRLNHIGHVLIPDFRFQKSDFRCAKTYF